MKVYCCLQCKRNHIPCKNHFYAYLAKYVCIYTYISIEEIKYVYLNTIYLSTIKISVKSHSMFRIPLLVYEAVSVKIVTRKICMTGQRSLTICRGETV